MASQNPIAGGPDFVMVLRNALEKRSGAYTSPPATGGTQISVRLSDDRIAILDAVGKASRWNRNQIINAFVDRGLFELFNSVSDDVVAKVMANATSERVIPTFSRSTSLMKELTGYGRFRIFPPPMVVRDGEPSEPLEETWTMQHVDRERETVIFAGSTQAGRILPPLHMTHIERVWTDTAEDAKTDSKNAMILLNVQITLTKNGPELLPFSEESALIKGRKL